ncbi:MAG: hypothetical protein NTZ93_01665 [Candidatus Beckwithbacteria bacterium]|nr:hypothetical protein [Candidatus Beckwithbacteria bacterium]
MPLNSLPELDQREIESTRHELNGLFHAVLNELDKSSDKVKFPAPVQFSSGNSLDSLSAKVASGVVSQLAKNGELLIAVEPGFTGPLFSVSQCSFMDGNRVRDARFIGSLFIGNFFARCLADGVEPKTVVKQAISEIVYQDVLMSAQKRERALVPGRTNKDLVVTYSGPHLSQR